MSADNPFEVSAESLGDRSVIDRDASRAEVSTRTIELLNLTRPWVQLIGVLLWIGTVLMGIGGIIGVLVGAAMSRIEVAVLSGVYVIIAAIYGSLAKSLTTYAKQINALRASESVVDLESALEAQKRFWRLMGIIVIVFIVVYIAVIVAAIAGVGITAAFQQR